MLCTGVYERMGVDYEEDDEEEETGSHPPSSPEAPAPPRSRDSRRRSLSRLLCRRAESRARLRA